MRSATFIVGAVIILFLLYETPTLQQQHDYVVYVGNITTSVVPDVVEDAPGKTCQLEHPDGGFTIFIVPVGWYRPTPRPDEALYGGVVVPGRMYDRGWIIYGGFCESIGGTYAAYKICHGMLYSISLPPISSACGYIDWRYGMATGFNLPGVITPEGTELRYAKTVVFMGEPLRRNEYHYYVVGYITGYSFTNVAFYKNITGPPGSATPGVVIWLGGGDVAYVTCVGRYRAMFIDPNGLSEPVRYVNCVLKWRHEKAALLPRSVDVWH